MGQGGATAAVAVLPQADRIVGVAPVARILYLETALPPVSRAKRNALLNYAIEDKLTIDPDTVHATVLGESREAEHVVAVVDKQWLTDVLTWLKAGGRAPQALVCEADAIAAKPGEWVVAPGAPHGFARRDDGFVLHLDTVRPDEVPFSLGLSLNEARNKGRVPSALALALPQERMGDAAGLCAAWQSALGVPVHAELRNGGAALALAASRANLLTGDFSPQRESALDRAIGKPVALLLAAMVLIHLVFGAIDLARMKSERERRIVAMTAAFRDVFPDAQTVVDADGAYKRLAQVESEGERDGFGVSGGDDVRFDASHFCQSLIANRLVPEAFLAAELPHRKASQSFQRRPWGEAGWSGWPRFIR